MIKTIRYCVQIVFISMFMINSLYGSNALVSNLIGTNLTSVNYASSQQPFVNEFKSANKWITQTRNTWDTKEEAYLNIDDNGWIKSLPDNTSDYQYTSVGTLLYRDHGDYLPGRYVVIYEGEGSLSYNFDARKIETLSSVGRDVIEVTPSKAGIWLSITETDPNQIGNYIKNIKIAPESYESNTNTEIFNPEFLDKIQPFSTLRFMDWMKTNNSSQKEWANRPKPENAIYSQTGVPLEIMVELANQTDTNPWFNIPHQASNDYIINFARYVKDNLEPQLNVYVEYSNEVWNWQFEQARWVEKQAKQEWSDSSLNKVDWYSKRTTEVVSIWDQVFEGESERVVGVMAAQAANTWTGQRALEYQWSSSPLSHAETGIDAIAIAPYFGNYIGNPINESIVENWTNNSDGGLDKLFQELTKGGLLENSPEGGALAQAYKNMAAYAELAEQENLQLLAYEGGQHLAGIQGVENNQAITDLFIAANRDPRMGAIYQDYLNQWFELEGNLFVNFSDIGIPTKWGNWGTLESVYQDSSPKYDAILDFIQSNNSSNQIIGEVGQVSNFNHLSQTIHLDNRYVNPVIFALPLSKNGGDEAIVRITNIQNDSFTAFLQEPEYKDGIHTKESFSYIVLEAGSWQLADGTKLEVGSIDSDKTTNSGWENISFQNSFSQKPVILSQVQTNNDSQFVRTRQKNADITSFSLSMEEEDSLRNSGHLFEKMGWLAIDPGQGSLENFSYQASHTGDEVTHRWHAIEFDEKFTETPYLFASLATFDGSDSAGLRYRNIGSTQTQIMIEEDRSLDSEINHTTEIVDFLAIAGEGDILGSISNSVELVA